MDRLSSCYFCGTALDEPLTEYPIVPAALNPGDTQRSVVVCRSCQRKLDTVMEEIVAAVEADRDGITAVDTSQAADSEAGDRATADRDAHHEHGDRRREGMPSTDPDLDGSNALEADEVDPFDIDEGGDGGGSDDGGSNGNESDDSRGSSSESDGSDSNGGGSNGDGSYDGESTSESAGEEPSLSAFEYNKVMRLVQNREFPLDRTEIETVAANAYDISRRDCARILDAAVDRGLLAERDGQLVRPDE